MTRAIQSKQFIIKPLTFYIFTGTPFDKNQENLS